MLYQSPGVYSREVDVSAVVPNVASGIGAIVGASDRGPVGQRVLIGNTKQMIEVFGNPNPKTSFMHYAAMAFLRDSKQLWVTRVANGALLGGLYVNKGVPAETSTSIGTGDGTLKTFTGDLGAGLVPGSARLTNGGTVVATDTGTGIMSGAGVTGTINYATGAVSVTFTVAPANAAVLAVARKNYSAENTRSAAFSGGVADEVSVTWTGHTDAIFAVVAANPGAWNNSLRVGISDLDHSDNSFVVNVYENRSGTNYLLESHRVSRQRQLDGYGKQQYIEDKILNASSLIRIVDNEAVAANEMPAPLAPTALTGGVNGTAVTDTQIIAGWDLYLNADMVDVNVLINGGYSSQNVHNKLVEIAETRKDCMAILDVPSASQSVSGLLTWRQGPGAINSSYAAIYSPDVEIYDNVNDTVLMVPPSGHVAAAYARTDYLRDPWFAPAGLQRGMVNARKLAQNYGQGDRDALYTVNINVLRSMSGEGITIWGQKTAQTKASATDRVNVRRLLLVLEKSISKSLNYSDFEMNNPFTRLQITQMVESFMRRVQARNGVYEYRVVCDESNNTPEVIDGNQMNVDVYLQPQKSAEFIRLQAVITRTGVSFDELAANGGNF